MEASGPNAEQIEYWNKQAGPVWVNNAARMDEFLAPIGLAAIERAAPLAGERVIDVGCGNGQTSLQLAERVTPTGAVLGVDISTPMLERARERARAAGASHVRFENADAQTPSFPPHFDLVFSRFGVALQFSLEVGPVGAGLRDAPASARAAAGAAIRELLAARATPNGVALPYATWIATGKR